MLEWNVNCELSENFKQSITCEWRVNYEKTVYMTAFTFHLCNCIQLCSEWKLGLGKTQRLKRCCMPFHTHPKTKPAHAKFQLTETFVQGSWVIAMYCHTNLSSEGGPLSCADMKCKL